MKTIIAVVASILLMGCSIAKLEGQRDVGKILDARVVATSFNESQKMQIKTERAVVVIAGFTEVPIGQTATIGEWSDGSKTISWGGVQHWILQ